MILIIVALLALLRERKQVITVEDHRAHGEAIANDLASLTQRIPSS